MFCILFPPFIKPAEAAGAPSHRQKFLFFGFPVAENPPWIPEILLQEVVYSQGPEQSWCLPRRDPQQEQTDNSTLKIKVPTPVHRSRPSAQSESGLPLFLGSLHYRQLNSDLQRLFCSWRWRKWALEDKFLSCPFTSRDAASTAWWLRGLFDFTKQKSRSFAAAKSYAEQTYAKRVLY